MNDPVRASDSLSQDDLADLVQAVEVRLDDLFRPLPHREAGGAAALRGGPHEASVQGIDTTILTYRARRGTATGKEKSIAGVGDGRASTVIAPEEQKPSKEEAVAADHAVDRSGVPRGDVTCGAGARAASFDDRLSSVRQKMSRRRMMRLAGPGRRDERMRGHKSKQVARRIAIGGAVLVAGAAAAVALF